MLFTNSISQASDNLPAPYNLIRPLPFDEHGWFGNGDYIESLIKGKEIKTAIEVGSWLGKSTRFIASKIAKDGKLYAIDTWLGSPTEAVHMQDPRLGHLYQLFLSNVIHAGLTHKIIPIRMDSIEAAAAIELQADFIYIDASHEYYKVFDDIVAWNSHLKPGGIMCGDDWLWEGVRTAVVQVADHFGKRFIV